MKHILVITHNFPKKPNSRKNAGIFIYDLVKELSKKNKISVFAPGERDETKSFGRVKVHFFKWENINLGNLKFWKIPDLIILAKFFFRGIKSLNSLYLNSKPDKSLALWAFPGGFFSYYLKKRYALPYSVWVLGSDIYIYSKIPILKNLITVILKNADKIIADGIDLKQVTEKLASVKCKFIPSSTNFASSKVKNLETQKEIVITFLGRLEKVKGPDILIAALRELDSNLETFKVNIIGDGSLMSKLKVETEKNRNLKSVKFYGTVEDQRIIYSILSKSDWVVIPSRSDSIPLVFSEAMKAGTPVIASDLSDFKYLIKKYKVGLLFKSCDFSDLSNILINLKKGDSQYEIFKKNTLTAARDFSIESSVKELLNTI